MPLDISNDVNKLITIIYKKKTVLIKYSFVPLLSLIIIVIIVIEKWWNKRKYKKKKHDSRWSLNHGPSVYESGLFIIGLLVISLIAFLIQVYVYEHYK